MRLLEVDGLTKRFGGLIAVNGVSFSVDAGQVFSVIGPNGAGKSTLFKLITHFLRPSAGRVFLRGDEITGLPPHVVARRGVVRTFQETTIFKEMSALQNVVVAHHLRCRAGTLGLFFNSGKARADERAFLESAAEILGYLGLRDVMHVEARHLPQGLLRALGIGIALAARPKLLLLDEPFAGLNIDETHQAVDMVRGIRDRGTSVLLVEHDMPAIMRISDRIMVLNFGTKIAEGTPAEIQHDEAVIEAYLGRADEEMGL